jgi:hypothetical protein
MKAKIRETGSNDREVELSLKQANLFNEQHFLLSGKDGSNEVIISLPKETILDIISQVLNIQTPASVVGGVGGSHISAKESGIVPPTQPTPKVSPPTIQQPLDKFHQFYADLLHHTAKYVHGRGNEKNEADAWYVAVMWEIVKYGRTRETVFEAKAIINGKEVNKTRRNINIGVPSYLIEQLKQALAISEGIPFNWYASLDQMKHTPNLDVDHPYAIDYVHELDIDDYGKLKQETDKLIEWLMKHGIKFKVIHSGGRSLHTWIPFNMLTQGPFHIQRKDTYTLDEVGQVRKMVDDLLVKEAKIQSSKDMINARRVSGIPYTLHRKTFRMKLPLDKGNYDNFRPEHGEIEYVKANINPRKYGVPWFN